jgi:ankyrin repeat protein
MMKQAVCILTIIFCMCSCAKQKTTIFAEINPDIHNNVEMDPDFQKNLEYILGVQKFIDDYIQRGSYIYGGSLHEEIANGLNPERVPRDHVYAGYKLTNMGMEKLYRTINLSDRIGLLELINQGMDLNVYNEQGKTPLDIAIGNRDRDIIEILIRGGAITAKEYLAIYYMNGRRARVYSFRSGYMWEAIVNDDYEMIDILIDAGINIDEPYLSALSYALSRKKDREIIIRLIEVGQVNVSHLRIALSNNYDVDICRRILESIPDLDTDALDNAFLEAVRWNDHLENIELLINAGANIRAVSNSGGFSDGNALIYGLLRGLTENYGWEVNPNYPDIVKLLTDAGLDVNEGGFRCNITPLHWAAAWDLPDIIKLLLDFGADIHSMKNNKYCSVDLNYGASTLLFRNVSYLTPLMLATNSETIKTLIDAGIDVNRRDGEGRTALMHLIAHIGYSDYDITESIQALLSAGADVNIKNKRGRSAYFFALATNNQSVINMLARAGAERISYDYGERSLYSILLEEGLASGDR